MSMIKHSTRYDVNDTFKVIDFMPGLLYKITGVNADKSQYTFIMSTDEGKTWNDVNEEISFSSITSLIDTNQLQKTNII